MAVNCPACRAEIPVDDINVAAGVALCRACQQVTRLQDLAGTSIPARVDKPAGTRIRLAEAGGRLIVNPPANRGLGWFLLLFGGFWDLISGIMLISVLLGHDIKFDGPGWLAIPFMAMFMLVGTAILIGGLYVLTVRVALTIGDGDASLVRAAFGREWIQSRKAAAATAVRRISRYTKNDIPQYGVEIVFSEDKPLRIGSGLSDAELAWLIGEIDHHLRRHGAKPG